MIVHGGLIALRTERSWRGLLVQGPSGIGKSTLALAATGEGFRLVADDRVLLWSSGGRLWGRAPDRLAGLVEVRGWDVVAAPALPFAEVALTVEHTDAAEPAPEPANVDLCGVRVPLIRLDLRGPALAVRLALVLRSHAPG